MSIKPDIASWPTVAFDTESTGLHWWVDKMFGFSICAPDGTAFYYDIRIDPGALEFARRELPKTRKIIAHNLKYDAHVAREAGILLPLDRGHCTMIGAAVINEHELEYGLESLAMIYTNARKDTSIYAELAKIFGGKPTAHFQGPNFHRAPFPLMQRYGCDDAAAVNALYHEWQVGEIEKQGLEKVIDLEMRLLPAVVRMEQRGVHVDLEAAEDAAKKIGDMLPMLQHELDTLAGFPVNPNPSKSIHRLFNPQKNDQDQWVMCDGTIAQKTPAGAASIDGDCLRDMKHPAAAMILRLRKFKKTKETFLEGHILGHHHNGVIHANYNQTKSDNDKGTGTGRFSINDPALQQIHKRDEDIAEVVRAAFIPPPGHDWCCNDWAQMDFRVFTHYVKNQALLEQYRKDPNTDFHQIVSDLTGIPRKPRFAGDANAKQINLGLVFGMGQGKLAAEMGLPYTVEIDKRKRAWLRPGEEAKEVFKKYHRAVPGVKDMLENASAVAKARGYVHTIMGRHIRFPHGIATYKAGGLIFQGSAADALKVKIIQVDEYLESGKGEYGYLALNVHDEFDSMIPKNSVAPQVMAEISRIVTDFHSEDQPIKFRVPIATGQGVGSNWWEASKD